MDSYIPDRHHPLSIHEEAQLADALDRKRKQIDREIVEYIADKEREYRKFEKRLRSEKRDAERQKILQCERELERAELKRRSSRDQGIPTLSNGAEQKSPTASAPSRVNGVRFAEATEIPLDGDTGYPNSNRRARSDWTNNPPDGLPVHEREVEFQGLFTPSYLPLLSGSHQLEEEQSGIDGTAASQSSDLTQSDQRAASALSPSRSAKQTTNSASSAPHTQLNSSSDPRDESMSHRRSSSRSDASIVSLRSSLRDPRQARSPKRVLFSIDNVVVSPSASLLTQRKATGQKPAAGSRPTDNAISDPKLFVLDHEIGTGRNSTHPVHWKAEIPSQRNAKKPGADSGTARAQSNEDETRPVHPAAQMARSSSPAMGGMDDFEYVGDEDDLFTFDEDLQYKGKGQSDTTRGRNGHDGEDNMAEEEGVDKDRDQDLLPTNSPHAGSLPIEIRWPGRKDSRGSK
ncbi:MAG: hypothetical protein Q9190_005958 [Brigantiaea leucoxantha]